MRNGLISYRNILNYTHRYIFLNNLIKLINMNVSKNLKTKVVQVFKEKGLQNIKIKFEAGSNAGDGYAGIMICADIIGVKDGCTQKHVVMIKSAPTKLELRKFMPTTAAFNREIMFYTKMVPIYKKIEDDYDLPEANRLTLATCYGCSNEHGSEFIIFNNLRDLGYTMINRPNSDYAHTAIAFHNLGKLHALSVIFEVQHQDVFLNLQPQLTDILYQSTEEFDSSGMHYYAEKTYVKFLDVIKNKSYKSKVKNAIGNSLGRKLAEMSSSGIKKLIMHGDSWQNNMMFKYQDEKVIEQIPLDFQVVRYGSMANDLLNFMALNSDKDLRKDLWKLLDVYYKSFGDQLNLLKFDVNQFCTKEEFVQEVKDQSLFCLLMNILSLPFFTCGEIFVAYELLAKKIPDSFYKLTDEYVQMSNDIVEDFVKFGFL